MGFRSGRPPTPEEHLVRTFQEERLEPGRRVREDGDAVRAAADRGGYGKWFAVLLGVVGIAALFLILYLLASLR